MSPSFTEELRDHFVERFGQASLTQTVPHWLGPRDGRDDGERSTWRLEQGARFLMTCKEDIGNIYICMANSVEKAGNCVMSSKRSRESAVLWLLEII